GVGPDGPYAQCHYALPALRRVSSYLPAEPVRGRRRGGFSRRAVGRTRTAPADRREEGGQRTMGGGLRLPPRAQARNHRRALRLLSIRFLVALPAKRRNLDL